MNLIPGRLRTRKFSVLIALFLLVVIAGVVAYLVISRQSQPGELSEREVARLEKVVAQNPDDPDGWVQLALLYSEAGFQQQAIAKLETALALNESHQGALVALGDVYMELGRYEEALKTSAPGMVYLSRSLDFDRTLFKIL
jgi:tetratricopeptide (TPR) repeat protein